MELTPKTQEIQRLLNIRGWKGFMMQFEEYARFQQALLSNAGGTDQQALWEKIEKEFRKLRRLNPAT